MLLLYQSHEKRLQNLMWPSFFLMLCYKAESISVEGMLKYIMTCSPPRMQAGLGNLSI